MVIVRTPRQLHPMEQTLSLLISQGKIPSINDLGGLEVIIQSIPSLASSLLAGEILAVILRDLSKTNDDDALKWREPIVTLVQEATVDTVLIEMIDVADGCENLPQKIIDEIFMACLQKATNISATITAYARSIALEGAFRLSLTNRKRQLRLLDKLLSISANDDPEYIRYAAKILGIAHSHWRENEIVNVLKDLEYCNEAAYEVTFELGMAGLTSALDEPNRDIAASYFNEALLWFNKAQTHKETAPEALLYSETLSLLINFEANRTKSELEKQCKKIHTAAFELLAWHNDSSTLTWLGTRHIQASSWNNLANTLISLNESLEELSWWEPAVVIESQVLAAYSAGRTILKRNSQGYLESLLRPRIENSIGRREGHAYLLKRWLLQNYNHSLVPEAESLISEIDNKLSRKVETSPHLEAGTIWAPVAAIISQVHCSEETKIRIKKLIENAFISSLENLSAAEIDIFDRCRSAVENHPDHRDNIRGAKLFDTVLLWTVRFLKNRLEMTKKDDPSIKYLFENVDGSLPHENALQEDYFRWLSTQTAAGEIEATNLGGGRADVALKATGERIVIEVKREMQNASFDAIAKNYAGQTTEYQNISIRLGFLLVLDLTEAKRTGATHIRSLVECRKIVRTGEDEPRYIVMVKVPGRRYSPSAVRTINSISEE